MIQPVEREPIPVTLLSGFLGAGKTTLMRHILQQNHRDGEKGQRVAVIVNDMAELNIDAKLVKSVTQTEEKMIQMQNGCICCTLREDLLVALKKLAEEGKFDYILIESTGISEPQQVAETFAFEDAEGVALNNWTRLDTLVTVVDSINFMPTMATTANVQDSEDGGVGEEDFRSLSALLVDQVEFADVILLNKVDLMKEEDLIKIEGILKNMNPVAKVIRTLRSEVPLDAVLNTKSFDLEKAATSPGWMKVMRGEAVVPETEEYGVSSFIYRRRKPFDPKKLYDLLGGTEPLPGVIRSKGFCWLAHLNDEMFSWASAGVMFEISPDMMQWFAATPPDEWGVELDYKSILTDFEGTTGDRRQEIVIIGHGMEPGKIAKLLDSCLTTVVTEEDDREFEDPWGFEEELTSAREEMEVEVEEGEEGEEEEEEKEEEKKKTHNHKHKHKNPRQH